MQAVEVHRSPMSMTGRLMSIERSKTKKSLKICFPNFKRLLPTMNNGMSYFSIEKMRIFSMVCIFKSGTKLKLL